MQADAHARSSSLTFRAMLLLVVAIVGFAYVKWVPYYAKAFVAQSQHSIGDSIISGKAAAVPPASWSAAVDYAIAYGKSIWKAMVLGLLLGSGIKVLLPSRWVAGLLGRIGWRSAALGGVLALPGMMCTCCAAPVAAGLRQRRASVGAAVSWWLANPVLNPATLVFMGFVLGWGWSLFRLVFGIVMVFGIAWLAERYAGAGDAAAIVPEADAAAPDNNAGLLWQWLREFFSLALRLLPEYLVLVLLLGAARVWLFPALDVGNDIGWIVAMALAGTLFVIPTAGEVPIVQAMLALGAGTGPAAALLMTLPAVSLPSLAMLGTAFSLRVRFVVALGVAAIGIVAGLVATTLL